MTIDDAEHLSDEQRTAIVAAYPPHEQEARVKGIPALGSGRIFPVREDEITSEPFEAPSHWVYIAGIDLGYEHPTAAVKIAHDRDADCIYITQCYRVKERTPLLHANALKPWGEWLPWAWPHDAYQRDKQGQKFKDIYQGYGLDFLMESARFEDGSNSVEAGLMIMLDRMNTGRFKVFKHCLDWFDEFRLYHRKDGLIVKEYDDLMDATRYAVMCLRHAIPADRTKGFSRDLEYQPLGFA